MKKLLLSCALLAGAAVSSFANQLTVLNNTNCSFFISLYEGGGEVYATPGFNDMYVDPSVVPSSTAPPTATFYAAAIRRDNFPDGFGVGTAPLNVQFRSSTDINDYPACHNGTAYNVFWNYNQNTGTVVLLIL